MLLPSGSIHFLFWSLRRQRRHRRQGAGGAGLQTEIESSAVATDEAVLPSISKFFEAARPAGAVLARSLVVARQLNSSRAAGERIRRSCLYHSDDHAGSAIQEELAYAAGGGQGLPLRAAADSRSTASGGIRRCLPPTVGCEPGARIATLLFCGNPD